MEVRTVGPEDAYLAPNYGTAGVVISVSGKPGTDYWDYLRSVDALLSQFDARVHWGKLHFLNPRTPPRSVSRGRQVHRDPPRARSRWGVSQRSPAGTLRLRHSILPPARVIRHRQPLHLDWTVGCGWASLSAGVQRVAGVVAGSPLANPSW